MKCGLVVSPLKRTSSMEKGAGRQSEKIPFMRAVAESAAGQ
jgi:hypothetical protein